MPTHDAAQLAVYAALVSACTEASLLPPAQGVNQRTTSLLTPGVVNVLNGCAPQCSLICTGLQVGLLVPLKQQHRTDRLLLRAEERALVRLLRRLQVAQQ